MTATTVAPDAATDVDDLLADLFGDDRTITQRQLSERLGVCMSSIRGAIQRGELTFITVTPKRMLASRAAVRRWLVSQQGGRR